MDEKIKELAKQAGYSKDYLAIGLPNNMEKFAELIVKECCQIVLECSITGSNNERDFMVTVREIKQHFGIEE